MSALAGRISAIIWRRAQRTRFSHFYHCNICTGWRERSRPEAETLLDSVRDYAERAPPFTRTAWREVALPGCEGLYSYARGEFERAWHHLSVAVPRMAEAGGSHAQRDLFEQVLLDAALRSGRLPVAQHMLELRRRADPYGVPVNTRCWPSVYGRLGLHSLADQARSRAALTRARHPSGDA